MPFGIASAPAIFQQIMEKILHGIPNVVCYLDDVLVTGPNKEKHLENLEQVFKRFKENGLRLKQKKCVFMKHTVEYLGFVVDAEGIHPASSKVEAVIQAQPPKDTKQLRSFLGLVNYYGRFIPDLAIKAHPLYELLHKKNRFCWSEDCQKSFKDLKAILSSNTIQY